jgi:hypothetical protein
LREIARKADAIWEVQYDRGAGQQELNWSWPGQRSAGRDDLDASAVQLQRDSTALTEAVTVVGGRRRREIVTDSAQFSAAFRVEITDTNSAVAEGQTLEVDYRLENIGTKSGSTDVELIIDGNVEDTDPGVSLASDGETTGTLQWATSSGDAGTYIATVRCADGDDQQTVTVTEPSTFDIAIDSVTGAPGDIPADVEFNITLSSVATNSPVTAGDDLLVSPLVDNVDTQEAGTLVTLEQVGGQVLDSQYLQTDGSQSPTLTWSTSAGDAGTYLLRVRAGFASETVTVTVESLAGPSPIHRWKFDDVSTTTAIDSIGSADGAINGATYVPGIVGSNALEFDGTNDGVDLPALQDLSSGFSITFWQRSPSQSGNTIIQFRGNNETYIRRESDFIGWNIIDRTGDNVGLDSDSTLDYSNNQFIAATYDGSEMKLYSNGSEDASASQGAMDDQGAQSSMGYNRPNNDRHFDGVLDDVRVYDQALTAAEIDAIYNSTK